jgi:ribosomal protein L9
MTKYQLEAKIRQIVNRAEKKGFKIHKNNIHKAKPINRICGIIKASAPYSTEELLCR